MSPLPGKLVVDSWKKVKEIPDYEVVAGALLFKRIFELNEGATSLFSFAKGYNAADEEMYKSDPFLKHAVTVISTVTAAVSLLEKNEMGTLVAVLKDLGKRHAALELEKAHYDLVGESLLFTLEKALGDSFTSSVKDAWVGVYAVITEQMMVGAKEFLERQAKEEQKKAEETKQAESTITLSFSLSEIAANSDPKIAEENEKIAKQKKAFDEKVAKQRKRELKRQRELTEMETKAKKDAESLITRSFSLTELSANQDPKIAEQNRKIEEEKKAYAAQKVVESWNIVKAIPNYESVVGELLFRRIFESSPGATSLFQFAQGYTAVDEEMYSSELFVKHSTAVVSTVTAAVGLLERGDMETLVTVLQDLGERHGAFDLGQEHYDLVGSSLLYTLGLGLGDAFTTDMEKAWVGVYAIITEQMMVGAKEYSRKKEEEENEMDQKKQAALLITKSYSLTEIAANADPKIAKQNLKIAEQKMAFEAKVAKKKERELRRQQKLSDDEVKANQVAANLVTKSFSLTELAANADPNIAEQNCKIAEQRQAFEAERLKADEANKSTEQLVVETWETIKSIPDYQKVAGELLFRKLFELNPGAASFFSFAKGYKTSDAELYQTLSFIKHSTSVISSVTAAVGLLESNKMDVLVSVLKDLGARHATLDLQRAHYELVGEALLSTLDTALGEAFTPKVKASWGSIYAVITEQMMLGAKEHQDAQASIIEKEKTQVDPSSDIDMAPSRSNSKESKSFIQMGFFKFWSLLLLMGFGGWLVGTSQGSSMGLPFPTSESISSPEMELMRAQILDLSESRKEIDNLKFALAEMTKTMDDKVQKARNLGISETRKQLQDSNKRVLDQLHVRYNEKINNMQDKMDLLVSEKNELATKAQIFQNKVEKLVFTKERRQKSPMQKRKRNPLAALLKRLRRNKKMGKEV